MTSPDWLHDAVFYQIFPERFANADHCLAPADVVEWGSEPTRDNFFGGDLKGIEEHLDHLVELGVNALYLTPIFQAATNHRYDAEDYFAIDPRLGDLDAFDSLLAAAHERGIRVVLDAVLNHCGKTHPYFRDVVDNHERSEYVDWYYVEDFPVVNEPQPNYKTCSGCEYLPKWNVHHPAVRDHHLDVLRYWIDRGIDGWRLDVPYFINMNFWRRARTRIKDVDEDLYIVAEEWREPEPWLAGDTADGTMNYTLRDLILGFTAERTIDAHGLAEGIERLDRRIPDGYHHGMLNLLGSHDTERILTRHRGDADAVLVAYAAMYACHGAPMIYYGDEIGMTGDNDPGCRGAMQWDQDRWDRKIHRRLVDLGRLRRDNISLRRGDQHVRALDADTLLIARTHESQESMAVIHRGCGTTITPGLLNGSGLGTWHDALTGQSYEGGVTLQGPSAVFLVRENRR